MWGENTCYSVVLSKKKRLAFHHIRCSIVVSISACHAENPGSIPGGGVFLTFRLSSFFCGVIGIHKKSFCRILEVTYFGMHFRGNIFWHADIFLLILHFFCMVKSLRYSLAGQDTRLSPERPGLESRWRNSLPIAPARQLVAAPLWSLSQPIDTALYDEFWQRQGKNNFFKKICATGRQ